jgi:hypothetical protein
LVKVEQLDIETIVPDHGEVCSLTELHEVKAYINDLLEIVTSAVRNNQSLDEISVPAAYQHRSLPRILNRICKPFRNGSLNVVKSDPDLQGYLSRILILFFEKSPFQATLFFGYDAMQYQLFF